MSDFEDYYEILQVHPLAEPEVIKAAYRKLAEKYHPDINKDPAAEERMKKINLAYETLSDSLKRKQYYSEWLREKGTTASSTKTSTLSEKLDRENISESQDTSSYRYYSSTSPRSLRKRINRRFGWVIPVVWFLGCIGFARILEPHWHLGWWWWVLVIGGTTLWTYVLYR